jgi:glycosyl hydrolase family 9/cellulase-like Ig domain-containing protein/PKD domain-containing protein
MAVMLKPGILLLALVLCAAGCVGAPAARAPASPAGDLESRLFPPPMDTLYENRLQAESAEYLSINLYNIPVDPTRASNPALFTITSPDDPAYAAGKQVRAVASGSRTRAIRVAIRKKLLVKGTHIFLKLPAPMKNGKTYGVTTGDLGAPVPALKAVRFDDGKQVNDNIRVNQLGYLPAYAKRAYLGQYMGDLGGMPFAAAAFELLDGQGRKVFSGPVGKRGVNDELVGQIVYELDFSAFKTPGTYRLRVPGVGLSYPFEIGPGALNPAFANLMRGHYHQRCGMAIDPAYSRHDRDACHLDDAYLEQKAEKTNFTKPKNPFYPAQYDNQRRPATRGHHDAGDYGKYTITGAGYVASVLAALDAFPEKLRNDNLGLPYSGNGIPDLVEECKWELDWLEAMQDDSDGGVFGVIRPNTGGYEHSMPPKESHRLFFPKDTVFTAAYAAALVQASRSPVMRKHYAADCDRYLSRARKAWGFLEKNSKYVEYFHYGAVFGDWDERCWAAAELYAATGEEKYHRYFLENFDPGKKRWDWWPLFEGVGYAVNTYLFLKERARDSEMLAKCRTALREACAMHLADSAAFPYRLSMPQPTIRHGNYGWVFPGDLAGYNLLMGYAVDGDRRYLECALDNLAYTCGANPSGYFLQTGLGWKRNIEVVSDASNSDGITEPIPGLPLGIGSGEFYWLSQYEKQVAEGTYPAKWPLMNRWYDGFNVSTEFTMAPMMRETIVAGFFSDLRTPPGRRPTVKIQADRTSGPGPLAVRFEIRTSARVRQVFWDFGDESFSTQRAPGHTFRDPGRQYPVAVTVINEDGLSAYDEIEVYCGAQNPRYPQEEYQPDAKTLLLFHLNGDLRDASGRGLELKAEAKRAHERRSYRFSSRPPGWMAQPRGSCLVLDGAEQLAVTIPQEALPDPASTPLTLEMMLYLQEFAGWSYPGDPLLLGLRNDWDSALGWQQDTWDKVDAPHFGKVVTSEEFARKFPRERWCQVKIAYDGQGRARFLVDGQAWGTMEGPVFKPGLKKPLVLTVGPFRGMVDEVRVRVGTD